MKEAAPSSILVIQLRRLGDVLLTTPALQALRLAFPSAAIDFLVERPGEQILAGNPFINRVLTYDARRPLRELLAVRRPRYDWVIDFMGNPRSGALTWASRAPVRAGPGHVFHTWAYNRLFAEPQGDYVARQKVEQLARTLGIPDPGPLPLRLDIPEENEREARAILASLGIAPGAFVLGVMPFHRRVTRRWPREHAASLLRALRAARPDALPLLFWGPGEEADARWIAERSASGARLIPDVRSLKTLAALIRRCGFAFCMDNGPHHFAVAAGVPTFTVFGATRPSTWNPPDAMHKVLRREELFCIGCNKNVCPYALECMNDLSPERVLRGLLKAMDAARVAEAAR